MKHGAKFIVQLRKYNRWLKTLWTRQGKAVSLGAARKAISRAEARFPESTFRVREVK